MDNNIETHPINRDILAGKWKQLRGELKTWWSELTDDDLDRIGGEKDKLIGLVQERYGYTREYAEHQVERRLEEYDNTTRRTVAAMAAKARELGVSTARKANEAAPRLGEKIKSLAGVIREKAPLEGKMGTTATKVAGGLESASSYLQERRFDHLREDFTGLIRRYPLQSLLVGLGLGFWLAGRNKK
jgi:uncharacterized protein YjbJ (UPF0337 family)